MFVRINGATHYLWRAVDHEGEVLEVFATKRRDRKAALKFLKRTLVAAEIEAVDIGPSDFQSGRRTVRISLIG